MILTPVMFKDKGFITAFIKIAIPIALQNLFVSSLGIIDTLMVGQVGETAIAAVGLANQVFFFAEFHPIWDHFRCGDLHGAVLGRS
jgi:Na+-driven multidrug efflux pump